MTELSPATQAVLNTLNNNWEADPYEMDLDAIAAALRAAVRHCQSEYWSEGEQRLAKRMLMISDELEAQ